MALHVRSSFLWQTPPSSVRFQMKRLKGAEEFVLFDKIPLLLLLMLLLLDTMASTLPATV
jgi:hypothetical protein